MALSDNYNHFNMSDLDRPRRCKLDSNSRMFGGVDPCSKSLALDGVVDVLKAYDEYNGGINCSVCGKLYKSRVCFTKHLWEHSIYWDLFDDLAKNQDRVLSIQAALILCGGSQTDRFQNLLVTTPQSHQSKSSQSHQPKSPQSYQPKSTTPTKSSSKVSPLRQKTTKRKRFNSGGSESLTSSGCESLGSDGVPELERRYDFDSANSSSDESHSELWADSPMSSSPPSPQPSSPITVCGSIKRRRLSGLPPKKRWTASHDAFSPY